MLSMSWEFDVLTKNVIGRGTHVVNVMGVENTNRDEMKFEALYS